MRYFDEWRNFKSNISLRSALKIDFLKSGWETQNEETRVSWIYFLYRLAFLLIFVAICVQSMTCDKDFNYYFIYMTNLSLIYQIIYSSLFVIHILIGFVSYGRREEIKITAISQNNNENENLAKLPILASIIWFLFNITIANSFFVSVIYWVFLYDWTGEEKLEGCEFWNNLQVHGLNAVLAIIDFTIVGIPMRVTHFIYTLAMGLAYFLFTIIYEYSGASYPAGQEFIYDIIDWKNEPLWACITGLMALAAIIIVHSGFWFLYKLRLFIVSKTVGPEIQKGYEPDRVIEGNYENHAYVRNEF